MVTSSQAPHHITLATYNTIPLVASEVYHLVTPYDGAYYYNILNLGPCTVYLRADRDPEPGDRETGTLPPFAADNLIAVCCGPQGLRVVAGPPCVAGNGQAPPCSKDDDKDDRPEVCATISVRLVSG